MTILSRANQTLTGRVSPNASLASDQSCQKRHLNVKCACVSELTAVYLSTFTAFIQSDTILEVLHFGEAGLLQVS